MEKFVLGEIGFARGDEDEWSGVWGGNFWSDRLAGTGREGKGTRSIKNFGGEG